MIYSAAGSVSPDLGRQTSGSVLEIAVWTLRHGCWHGLVTCACTQGLGRVVLQQLAWAASTTRLFLVHSFESS